MIRFSVKWSAAKLAHVCVGASVDTAVMLMSQKFLTHQSFAALVDLGWQLEHLGAPVLRPGSDEFVRVATFRRGEQGVSVDVDRHSHMSQFATYTAEEDITLIAETPDALISLAASPDTARIEEFRALDDVTPVSATCR